VKLLLSTVYCLALTASCLLADDPDKPAAAAQDLTQLDLEQLMEVKVEAASMHEQSLEDAPASVTIITQDEIRRYGWRTLAQALSYAGSLFTSNDRSYTAIGVRGFGLPGDFGTRFLIMVNGHNMADNIFSQTAEVEQNFPLDMTLVKRIEIIRGPSSALYGSNGIFATINVVTIPPEEFQGTMVRVETGSFGEKKVQAASSVALGHGATLLLSGSVLNNAGEHSIYFPEADTPATNFGRAIDMNSEKGYHLFGDFTWHNWRVTALFGGTQRIQPISWGPTIFNDRGTRITDFRNFVEATYTHTFDAARVLEWRTSYDSYRSPGIFHYPLENGVEDNRNFFTGDWISSRVSYRTPVPHFGTLTVGAETQFDLRALQRVIDVQPVYQQFLSIDKRDRYVAFFAQEEWELTRKWKLDVGARFDYSRYHAGFLSPRVAVIYQPSPRVSYKLLYGRAFRNPSAYMLFYDDSGYSTAANPAARPEKANTYEFDVERKVTRRLNATLSVCRYTINDLLVGTYTPAGLFQIQNADRVRASGVEAGINGHPVRWLEVAASFSVQRAVNLAHRYPLADSPGQVGNLRFSVPLFSNRLSLSAGVRCMGTRQSLAGATLPSLCLSDFTLSSQRLPANMELQAGVRDLAGVKYADPVALAAGYDTMPQPARSVFLTLTWRRPE
jgi:outer membrane receptor protein involved in Fe transport